MGPKHVPLAGCLLKLIVSAGYRGPLAYFTVCGPQREPMGVSSPALMSGNLGYGWRGGGKRREFRHTGFYSSWTSDSESQLLHGVLPLDLGLRVVAVSLWQERFF